MAAIASLWLAGCNTPPAPAPAPERQADVPQRPLPRDGPLDELQRQWSERLDMAERKGQVAQAALALDVLVMLDAPRYQQRRKLLQLQIDEQVRERQQHAQQAHKAGKLEAAEQLYLSALALQPDNADAAAALRAIDRARNKRDYLGQPSQITLTRRYAVPATTAQLAARVDASMAREHASMLATQGDLGEAIAVLEDQLARDRRDAATRSMLVELYVRQAQGLRADNAAASRAALNKALRLSPQHAPALALMQQLPPPVHLAPAAPARAAP